MTLTDPVFYTKPVTAEKKWAEVRTAICCPYECAEEAWNIHLEQLAEKAGNAASIEVNQSRKRYVLIMKNTWPRRGGPLSLWASAVRPIIPRSSSTSTAACRSPAWSSGSSRSTRTCGWCCT